MTVIKRTGVPRIEEIEESYPLRGEGQTVEQFAAFHRHPEASDEEHRRFAVGYRKLSDLGNMDHGSERGKFDAGDAVKACYAENGFELTLLMLLYRVNEKLNLVAEALDKEKS